MFKVVLITGMLTWVMINPYNGETKWKIEGFSRVEIASISCLAIGWISLPLIIGQIFYQDIYITKLAENCQSAKEEEKEVIGMMVEKGKVKAIKLEMGLNQKMM